MKIVHHHANDRFDWLISEHQSVNPLSVAISILSDKYKRFTFVHPVCINIKESKVLFETRINVTVFLSASLQMTRINAHKRGLQRCESFHHNKEAIMEVMICGKLHAAIRYE